ncbi:YveK family protein [Fonticella tunisiensis]|uniref:Capsular polysaccharide biosynthesis protein n=1 Tax=Fonticella tunisiensis TaxID=1096341 RepID=A0A4R7K5F3_9CLOT|nr:Wzz/FepE/Etk N-terminal domain-containing protein [Fonticella tunisiensis]TDT46091.1 capsular polysaccharide biosynthesis protein [Fonticella tunisiensis]
MELYQIMETIKRRLLLIAVITILSTSISAAISYFYITPQYKATTTLIIGKMPDQADQKIQYSDIMMYQKLVKTYVEIAKSEGVAEKTVERLSLNLSPEKLRSKLTAAPASDTEVLYLSIVDEKPEEAAFIANGLAEVFMKRVKELMKVENVQIIDYAKVPKSPIKPKPLLNTAIGFFLGIMISLGVAFLLEYMDSTVKDADDVEDNLELPVIGIIPLVK